MIFINNIFRFCEIIFSKLHFFEWDEHLYYKQQLYLCLGADNKQTNKQTNQQTSKQKWICNVNL